VKKFSLSDYLVCCNIDHLPEHVGPDPLYIWNHVSCNEGLYDRNTHVDCSNEREAIERGRNILINALYAWNKNYQYHCNVTEKKSCYRPNTALENVSNFILPSPLYTPNATVTSVMLTSRFAPIKPHPPWPVAAVNIFTMNTMIPPTAGPAIMPMRG